MKINDIDLKRWKDYADILTDSLWIISRRDNTGVHNPDYWGNFIPQIPNQLLRRYTKTGDWVLDPFMGSGTTLIEAKRLKRNSIGIDINEKLGKYVEGLLIDDNYNLFTSKVNVANHIVVGDSATVNLDQELNKVGINKIQFIIFHPPYADIIKFTSDPEDLSNKKSIEEFVNKFMDVFTNCIKSLEDKRYFAVVIGDKYEKSSWIPLGFYLMDAILKKNYRLKSIIIKNFEETLAKRNQKSLWRYRALAGNFYVFKHEYIFIFHKR